MASQFVRAIAVTKDELPLAKESIIPSSKEFFCNGSIYKSMWELASYTSKFAAPSLGSGFM